tara:strand:+ start:140 stop:568 length:429 start_codon:yes stop_codon:yes gene_type:complete
MPTTTASIALSSDIGESSISLNNTMTLLKAGSGTEGMDEMTSVSKIMQSNTQVDLLAAATAGSTDHNFLYIKNPSTNPAEFFRIALGASPSGSASPSIIEELGYLYAGDWMFIPWKAADTAYDVMITPSVSTDMNVEYMIFS